MPYGPAPGLCPDPEDDRLLGCAAAAGTDYLVTGDTALLAVGQFAGVRVMRAREFLVLLGD